MRTLSDWLSHAATTTDPLGRETCLDEAEIQAVRQQLIEKYRGNLRAYSQSATATALALGFKFIKLKPSSTAAQLQ